MSSFVVATVTSAVDPSPEICDGGVSGARLSSSSPQATPVGVTTDFRSGIARSSQSARMRSAIRAVVRLGERPAGAV